MPPTTKPQDKAAQITPAILRDKRRRDSPLTVNELVLVYRWHTHQYYRKNGEVTREATITDDVIRYLRKHHATTFLDDFGPVALDELRDGMITDLDWSRKHINKQVNRLIRMFTWSAEKELVAPASPLALKSLAGLKKGRTTARETDGVTCVDDAVVDATVPHRPDVVADMVRLQRLTGSRPGEVCSLRPCDLDRSSDVWLYYPSEHKTEHHQKEKFVGNTPIVAHAVRLGPDQARLVFKAPSTNDRECSFQKSICGPCRCERAVRRSANIGLHRSTSAAKCAP